MKQQDIPFLPRRRWYKFRGAFRYIPRVMITIWRSCPLSFTTFPIIKLQLQARYVEFSIQMILLYLQDDYQRAEKQNCWCK
ncbi:MAG: hypothetical protein R3E08_13000 [Thiotrichaceae bacterium]